MSVWELYTQSFARNWKCRRFAQSVSQRSSEKIRKKDVDMTSGSWSSWSIQIPQFLILWLLALDVLFLPLNSLTICYAFCDCLSSSEFLILSIWPWFYSDCSVLICATKFFLRSGIYFFLNLNKVLFVSYLVFSFTSSESHGTLHLTLCLVGMHSAAASMWAVTKFTYSSFGVCLSNISWRVSNLFLTVSVD